MNSWRFPLRLSNLYDTGWYPTHHCEPIKEIVQDFLSLSKIKFGEIPYFHYFKIVSKLDWALLAEKDFIGFTCRLRKKNCTKNCQIEATLIQLSTNFFLDFCHPAEFQCFTLHTTTWWNLYNLDFLSRSLRVEYSYLGYVP